MDPLPTKRPISLFLILPLLSASALLGGCARKTTSDAVVDAALKRYDRVRTGMSRQEVVALLGEPSHRPEGRYRWEAAGRPQYHASLEVKFNSEDRVASVARTRAKD